jgi:hypothetical protein
VSQCVFVCFTGRANGLNDPSTRRGYLGVGFAAESAAEFSSAVPRKDGMGVRIDKSGEDGMPAHVVNAGLPKRRDSFREPLGRANEHDSAVECGQRSVGCAIDPGLCCTAAWYFARAGDQFIRVMQDEVDGLH